MGYDACFFCLGVSSVFLKADDYKRLTYDLTLEMGRRLAHLSPNLTFCYVTGMSTDSTEKGSVRWARVKGATENELLRLFKYAYMLRSLTLKLSEKNRIWEGDIKGRGDLKNLLKPESDSNQTDENRDFH